MMGASGRRHANSELLILPGADMWDTGGRRGVRRRRALLDAGVPAAATCGATAGLARAGLLDERNPTSAAVDYLAATGYRGSDRYVEDRDGRRSSPLDHAGAGVRFVPRVHRRVPLVAAQGGQRGRVEPVLFLADVLVEVEHRVANGLLALGFEDVDRGEQFAHFAVLADQRSDVLGEHLLARHDPEQPGFLAPPVRGQFGRHLAQQVTCTAQVAAVDRAHNLPTEV